MIRTKHENVIKVFGYIQDVAELHRTSASVIRSAVNTGALPSHIYGGRRHIWHKDAISWALSQPQPTSCDRAKRVVEQAYQPLC